MTMNNFRNLYTCIGLVIGCSSICSYASTSREVRSSMLKSSEAVTNVEPKYIGWVISGEKCAVLGKGGVFYQTVSTNACKDEKVKKHVADMLEFCLRHDNPCKESVCKNNFPNLMGCVGKKANQKNVDMFDYCFQHKDPCGISACSQHFPRLLGCKS